MARHDAPFANVDTAADDTCLLAFTSGTTGQPKATMHFHRDVMASCVCFPPHVLRADAGRRLHRQPAARLHLRPGRPDAVPDARRRLDRAAREGRRRPSCSRRSSPHRATVLLHRADLVPRHGRRRRASAASACATAAPLRKCVSAGEALPAATRALWREATGIEIIDGIGATEMLHIFISADEAQRAARRHRQGRARLPRTRRRRRRPRRAAPARSAASRCRARPAAATSTTRARPTT